MLRLRLALILLVINATGIVAALGPGGQPPTCC
jgi:hypothetical protein